MEETRTRRTLSTMDVLFIVAALFSIVDGYLETLDHLYPRNGQPGWNEWVDDFDSRLMTDCTDSLKVWVSKLGNDREYLRDDIIDWFHQMDQAVQRLNVLDGNTEKYFRNCNEILPDFPAGTLGLAYWYHRKANFLAKSGKSPVELARQAIGYYKQAIVLSEEFGEKYDQSTIYIGGLKPPGKPDAETKPQLQLIPIDQLVAQCEFYIRECSIMAGGIQ